MQPWSKRLPNKPQIVFEAYGLATSPETAQADMLNWPDFFGTWCMGKRVPFEMNDSEPMIRSCYWALSPLVFDTIANTAEASTWLTKYRLVIHQCKSTWRRSESTRAAP
ncbi:hypothetical protein IF1G_04000 [Cordyceps javanica]|uniref:Uncharacterized protein n=1 Tax=Cordyceps javanica TaxID=43265 RepID=A0A545V4W8_9HYPO|nr:hypothetical protein IF1G_04000 [Cordyceps javanica]